jgi:uncharacterized protein
VKTSLLNGKKGLLTGASSGIGRALAKALARSGVKLVVSARRKNALDELADEIEREGGPRPVVITADLSLRGEAQRLGLEALHALGEIDILVNNAGVGIGGQQAVVADDDMARVVFETNYWSALALQRVVAPGMKKRKSGSIVNVTSIGAIVVLPLAGHYSSSKAALSLASEALRMELRDFNVHVFNVMPGPVETAMLNEMRVVPGGDKLLEKMPRGDVDTLARKVVRGIERKRKEMIYPTSLAIMRHLPTLAVAMNRRMSRVVDVTDERAVMGGSSGDELIRAARTAYEQKDSVTHN